MVMAGKEDMVTTSSPVKNEHLNVRKVEVTVSPVKNEHLHNIRKSKKPLMEKRRRARINGCLTQLKNLILHAIKKDSSQFSKLEKADILEMAVKHVQCLQNQQAAAQAMQGVSKFQAGYQECATEIFRYMASESTVDNKVKERLMGHLSGCLQAVNVAPVEAMQQQPLIPMQVLPHQLSSGAPSILMPCQNSQFHPLHGFATPSRPPSTLDCPVSSPVPLPSLSALPGQHVSTVKTTAPTVLVHDPTPVPGAFPVMPLASSVPACTGSLYGAGSPITTSPRCADTTSVSAIPRTSHPLPHPSQVAVTAFVTPPPISCMTSARNVPSTSPSELEAEDMKMAQASPLVDLRQTSRTEDSEDKLSSTSGTDNSDSCPTLTSTTKDSESFSTSTSSTTDSQSPSNSPSLSCSYSSMADERLWRPW